MERYLPLLEHIILKQVVSNSPPVTGITKLLTGLGLISLLFGVMALCTFLYASFLWLVQNFGMVTGLSYFSLMLFGVSILFALMIWSIHKIQQKHIERAKREILVLSKVALEEFSEEIDKNIKSQPLTAVGVAALIGYMTSRKFL